MVDDIYTVCHITTSAEEQMYRYSGNLKEEVKHELTGQLADAIADNFDITEDKQFYDNRTKYELKVTILTPNRYEELLEAEHRLSKLEQ